MNPLDAYLINQSHNPGKLTFVNASFWGKRAAEHKLRHPFNFELLRYPPRTILRVVLQVSSSILRAKPWLAKKFYVTGIVLPLGFANVTFRRERRDDQKYSCCSRAMIRLVLSVSQPCSQGSLLPALLRCVGENPRNEVVCVIVGYCCVSPVRIALRSVFL